MKKIVHIDRQQEEWRAGVSTRMHVSALNGATQLCIFEQWVAPTVRIPTHRHPVEEVLTVVAGEAEVRIDEELVILTGGQSLIVPADRDHGFQNVGSETLHMHCVLASSFFEMKLDGKLVRRWLLPAAADGGSDLQISD